MSQTQICRGTATTIATQNGVTVVTYHNTKVVQWDTNTITLDSGGWRTVTTKTRMNQASNQFDLKFTVCQTKGNWSVSFDGKTIPFSDGMTLKRQDA